MNEASKTNDIRSECFKSQYFNGKVIDIGAGSDLVCDHAENFDQTDGDANVITEHRDINAYDCVHSSHCLEHMHDPKNALQHWWALVRPGGYLIIVVPDEDLYEQGVWPSVFNKDHKATFTLKQGPSWSPVSFNIETLVQKLPDVEVLSVEIHDRHYDYALHRKLHDVTAAVSGRTLRRFFVRGLSRIVTRLPKVGSNLQKIVENLGFYIGVPVDQTKRDAVAQIQVVARKLVLQ